MFNLSSSVSLQQFQKLRFAGEYELIQFNEKKIVVLKEGFIFSCEADEIQIDMLAEHQLILSFQHLRNVQCTLEKGSDDVL